MAIKMSGFDAWERKFTEENLMRSVQSALDHAIQYGAQRMADHIETRGTGNVWNGDFGRLENGRPGRTGSIPGRVASGTMRDAVDSKITKRTATTVAGEMGWLEGSPEYAMFQELGFKNALTGASVDGMFALRDSSEEAWEMFKDELAQIVKEYTR